MTPVINPWVFYLMPICEKFVIAAWLFFVFTLICALAFGIGWIAENDSYNPDEDKIKLYAQRMKKAVAIAIIIAMLACLIPSEATVTKMIVAQNVTVERVDMVSDTVVTVYNDIMNLFRDSGAANG